MCSQRTFIFGGEKLHVLQFLTNTSTIISYRNSLMATDWTRSLSIEISWSFVTISNFKFDISLFMGEICASSSSVFFSFFFRSFLLPLHNFTYWPSPMSVGDFSTVVASYVYISLWNSLMTWSFIWHLWQVCESVCSLWFIVLYALSKNYKLFCHSYQCL